MMEIISLLSAHPFIFIITLGLFGLCMGSFLNVVIHRMPIMLQNNWRAESRECLELPADETNTSFNLFLPRSHCPQCRHTIKAWQNIPLLSYVFLGGKCKHCDKKISIRYPAIEILTALLSIFIAWHFDLSLQTLFALLFTYALISLTVIDSEHFLLPDAITMPTLWLGLLINLFNQFATINDAIIGALAGYLSLWAFAKLFKLLTGKGGMGNGDFKLFAMLGAWLGWQLLPFIILFASLLGSIVGIGLLVVKHQSRQTPIPFGPYLALSGWVAMLWGQQITEAYLQFAGF